MKLSRRQFIGGTVAAAVGTGLLGFNLLTDSKPVAANSDSEVHSFRNVCPRNCYDTCGQISFVQDGILKKVEGDPKHGYTNGRLCVKGYTYTRRVYSPDRIKAYALTISRIHKARYSMLYQLTVSTMLYLVWVLSTLAGVVLGSYISDPLTWGLDFAMPATFLVLLIPLLVDRISLIVFGIAAVVSVFAALYLPGKWYIIIACLTASLIGGLLEGDSEHA